MRTRIFILIAVMTFLVLPSICRSESPIGTIDFWQRQYEELRPEGNPGAKRAHEIFNRLVKTAGSRPGVVPRLFVSKSEPKNISLPIVIPDGSVIISAKTIEICYRDAAAGDDRLAFVLGHELAHLMKDDFWHIRFFNAISTAETEKRSDHKTLSEIKEIAGSTDKVIAKELQADEFGAIYASMAGFNPSAIIDDQKTNFFVEWLQAMDPFYSESAPKDPDHPTPEQRAETIKTRLRQVVKNLEVFNLGLAFYQTGQFQRAIPAFERFMTYFPSREVYHDLAAAHHQLALKYFAQLDPGDNPVFKLSISIDPQTRASGIMTRGGDDPRHLFSENLRKAIELYQRAIAQDPAYVPASNNLACALILRGEEGDAYRAIALLKDALKIEPQNRECLNTLGAAFYFAENYSKAAECFLQAGKADPSYDPPLFNLGLLLQAQGKVDEAGQYWSQYLRIDTKSRWAAAAGKYLGIDMPGQKSPSDSSQKREEVLGIAVGAYDQEVPKSWGEPKAEVVPLDRYKIKISNFQNDLKTISQNKEIKMIVANSGFPGKTVRGVGIGCPRDDVISLYGDPTTTLDMTRGNTMVYEEIGISFNFQDGKLASWVLF